MIRILNSKESKQLDLATLESTGISENILIDNAGKAIAHHIIENIEDPFNETFLLIAGFGKNGLDAIVANFYMHHYGLQSYLYIIDENKIPSKFDKYLNSINKINSLDSITKFNWVVDGVFGNGLNRNIEGLPLEVVRKIIQQKNIIAIDIPTGILADTGESVNIFVKARETISFGFPKCGHYLSEGFSATGKLSIYDIGQIRNLTGHPKTADLYQIISGDITQLLKNSRESVEANKYSRGQVLVYGGSENYTGAALLSASAALSCGAGIVKLMFNSKLSNSMTRFMEGIDIPIKSKSSELTETEYSDMESYFKNSDCMLIGPGLSISRKSLKLTNKILRNYKGKCIIDAGALAAIDDYDSNGFESTPNQSILTPHYGELSKIININVDEIRNNVVKILLEISKKLYSRILILKGPNTIIVNGDGELFFIINGDKKLATAGTGDILAGMIASYVSRGHPIIEAAIIGAYHHAECSNFIDKSNIIASELLDVIGVVKLDQLKNRYEN